MKVLWLHNYPSRAAGTFMWDIYDRLRTMAPPLTVEERKIPLLRRHGALREALRLARIEPGWDIVHAQFGSFVGVVGALGTGRPYIVSLRGSDIYWRYGSGRDRLEGIVRAVFSWIACLRSDVVVVMSQAMAQRVRSWPGLRRRLLLFIPDPAGETFWPPAAARISENLLSEPYAIVVASLKPGNPVKRTELVMAAAALCQQAGMALQVEVLTGIPREKVRNAIEGADCIALASTHEGWPNIIKEGLLLGKAFVSTDVSDLAAYAPTGSINRIVGPHAIEFSCAWVDQIAARLLARHGISPALAPFHPDAVALKHRLLYLACRRMKS